MELTQLTPILVISILLLISIICLFIYFILNYIAKHKKSNTTISLTEIIIKDNKDWGFFVTEDKVGKLMSYDNNKLYFTEDCLIQTNNCFKDSTKHSYFEIEVLNLEDDAQFHFGLALSIKDNNFKDSSILLNIYSKKIELYGKSIEWINFPTIDEGDVIGCLYYSSPRNEAMFTYNGQEIITLKFGFNKAKLFPTIYGIKGCFINYNFGREPFHYQPANYYNYGLVKPSTKSEEPPNYS